MAVTEEGACPGEDLLIVSPVFGYVVMVKDDAGFALDVFDGVSNDEFPISLAVIERESSIVSFKN